MEYLIARMLEGGEIGHLFFRLMWTFVIINFWHVLFIVSIYTETYGASLSESRDEIRFWLAANKPNSTTPVLKIARYWAALLWISFYLWPFRILAVNLGFMVFFARISRALYGHSY